MNTHSGNKINVLLGLLLVLVLGVVGFLGYNVVVSGRNVEVPDLLGKKKEEVFEWCGKLDAKYSCELVYEESRSVEEGIVFQQSLNAGSKLTDKITFTISSGLIKQVALPQLNNATRVEIEKWASKNEIKNVEYIDESSDTFSKGTVIRIDPSEGIYTDTPVKVYVSSGKEGESENGDIEVKAGEYLNLTVSRFETQVKELGLVPNHSESRDSYNSSVSKGNIVWHGSGTYVKGETINYGICIEGSDSDIVVKSGEYVGKSESEIKSIATELGIKANHNTEKDAYSDTVAKGNVVWHGSGNYVKNETFNYGLSLGKKDQSSDSDANNMTITKDQYVGLKEDEVKQKTEAKGLKPTHLTSRDAYSDTVAKGLVVTHGYGDYEKGEAFNYGLSLGKKDQSSGSDSGDMYISQGQYVGQKEDEVKQKTEAKGLKPTHLSDRDAYSDTIEKGLVVTHGYGEYEKGEAFNYGLSLGKAPADAKVEVKDQSGSNEDVFKNYISGLGLTLGTRSVESSETVDKGKIIRNDTGTFNKGDKINYTVSGGSVSTGTIMRPEKYTVSDTYDGTKKLMESYLSVFSKVTYVGVSSSKGVGRLEKIEVGSDGASYSEGSYPTDTPIKVYIVNEQTN